MANIVGDLLGVRQAQIRGAAAAPANRAADSFANVTMPAIDFGRGFRTTVMNYFISTEFELACRNLSRLLGGAARRERTSFSSMVSAATLTILGEERRITIRSGAAVERTWFADRADRFHLPQSRRLDRQANPARPAAAKGETPGSRRSLTTRDPSRLRRDASYRGTTSGLS